jgi:hypothetical protein
VWNSFRHYALYKLLPGRLGDRAQEFHRRRGAYASGGKGLMGGTEHIGAELVAVAVQVKEHRLYLAQIPHQIRPRGLGGAFLQAPLQIHLQAQGQEAGHDVTDRVTEIHPGIDRTAKGEQS